MADECKMAVCQKIWTGEVNTIAERVSGISTGLSVQAKELERRMHEANDIKKEFGNKIDSLDKRIVRLETKSIMWLVGISGFFTLLQIFLKFWE